MKQFNLTFLLTVLMSMVGAKASAYDIAVENADGVTIYYNYINNTDLEVTRLAQFTNSYKGRVVIPETVTYEGHTYNITAIGKWAFDTCSLTEVIIPNSVISIGEKAFYSCTALTSVTIGNNVKSIGDRAFEDCFRLPEVTIPNSVTSIGSYVFSSCEGLTKVTIGNGLINIGNGAFLYCLKLTEVTIPDNVKTIGEKAFCNCTNLTKVTIGNGVTQIGTSAFANCERLTKVTIPDCVTTIGPKAFQDCIRLTEVAIGSGVTSIGWNAFRGSTILKTLYSLNITPPYMEPGSYANFTADQYATANVYVPKEALEAYRNAEGWKDFLNLQAIMPKKCATPTIQYVNNELIFDCETEDVTFESTITDKDIASYSSNRVKLGVTYNISVYATKTGYDDSDMATATLCWIDVEPKTEGITAISQVEATPVLIQSASGQITVTGLDDGTMVAVYGISGQQVGTAVSTNGQTIINTNLAPGSIAIVKIGDRSIKITMK